MRKGNMAAKLWKVGTSNAFNTTLNGSINATDVSIILTTASGLQAPGVVCIDRVDSNNVATNTVREYISFTGISTNTLTGCTRGLGGSTAQAHSSGAKVEENLSITHWNDLVSFLGTSHDASGNILASLATIATARFQTAIDISGASVLGNFPLHPCWVISGYVSLATTGVGQGLPMPNAGVAQFFSAVLQGPVSGATLILDINQGNTSLFTDQNTRLVIPGGGTYVSTASIGNRFIVGGQPLSVDIDAGGGLAYGLTVLGRIS
jgi:hypothetical protein